MENIYSYLNGIENLIQQMVINPTVDNVKIIQIIFNTLAKTKSDLKTIEKQFNPVNESNVVEIENSTEDDENG